MNFKFARINTTTDIATYASNFIKFILESNKVTREEVMNKSFRIIGDRASNIPLVNNRMFLIDAGEFKSSKFGNYFRSEYFPNTWWVYDCDLIFEQIGLKERIKWNLK